MKERVTITLENDILRQLDDKIDGFKIKNRSHAIELLIHKSLGQDMPKTALIMAAGKMQKIKTGRGVLPIKMALINGRPVLEHIISLFKRYNIRNIYIAICYYKDMIKDYFGDGSQFGVNIHYIEEDEPSGTSNLLKKIQPYVKGPFFVANADELKDINLIDMYRFHKITKSTATIALTTADDTSNYGVIKMDGIRIKNFTEKPHSKKGDSKIINSGLYLFNPEIIDLMPNGSRMLYDFLPKLVEKGHLLGYVFTGQWYNVSSPDLFEEAKKKWKNIN